MQAIIQNQYGDIAIPLDTISKMAGLSASQCYGVVGMAFKNKTDGLVNLLHRDSLSKGVKITVENKNLIIDLHVVVEYGVSIHAISENIISNVRYFVESSTGFKVKSINIHVDSLRV